MVVMHSNGLSEKQICSSQPVHKVLTQSINKYKIYKNTQNVMNARNQSQIKETAYRYYSTTYTVDIQRKSCIPKYIAIN